MEYIDKSKNRAEGIQITEEYLEKECCDTSHILHNIRYSTPKRPTSPAEYRSFSTLSNYKQRMVSVVMENQNRYCCYCLRKINGAQEKTLEHIIPQSSVSSDAAVWAYYQRVPELDSQNEVKAADVFEGAVYQRGIPHPHVVAYNNFVASCDGTFPDKESVNGNFSSCCCNNRRGNDRAFPIFYLKNVGNLLSYTKEGRVEAIPATPWYDETYSLIENTVLNFDSLVQIRKMWYKLRTIDFTKILEGNNDETKRRSLLYQALFPNDDMSYNMENITEALILQEKYMKQSHWDTFILYHKFHQIMRDNYPN